MSESKLVSEIAKAERSVSTDGYDMSVGELINLYRDNEIDIDPEYQRLFRWDIRQKSNLIESLLLGIPIPAIFVFEGDNGVWELIDGLQRLSTILQFVGELRVGPNGKKLQPEPLVSGRYLESLEGLVWDTHHIDYKGARLSLPDSERIRIKRSRISIQILRRTSDSVSKFDLFQRLNSGGSKANRQELRNCLVVMQDRKLLARMRSFTSSAHFSQMFRFTKNQISEQTDVEYVNRALVLTEFDFPKRIDVEDFFDERTIDIMQRGFSRADSIFLALEQAFTLLNESAGRDALYRPSGRGQPSPPLNTALEVIVVGVARNISAINKLRQPGSFIRERLSTVWQEPEMSRATSSGMAGRTRLNITVPFGARWFKPA